jgi:mannitol/fructose-specific phosphotransferase system IIA component (Ntr-type)
MELRQLFAPEDVVVGFAPKDKWDAIRALVEHLAKSGRIPAESSTPILAQILARERSMSTGMERGIAIPHAAVDQIDRVIAAIGIVARPEGLDFESIDGQPARLVVLLVIPRSQKLLHIRTLADVARVLGSESVRESLLAATSPHQAWEALASGDGAARR